VISDLKRAKFTHYFHAMDTTGDGLIREADYLAAADRVIAVLGMDAQSEDAQALKASYRRLWDNIEQADSDGDHAVTVDEWVDLQNRLAADTRQFESVVLDRGYVIMRIFDRDHDSRITLDDWQLFFRTTGVAEEHFATAFHKLDRDGNGYLTIDEIAAAGREFFGSDDPDAPGNWLYGDYTKYL
jgi:Ca2+-binding EF-hand superfamily protein